MATTTNRLMEKEDLSEGVEEVDAVTTIVTTTKKPETTSQHKQVTKHTLEKGQLMSQTVKEAKPTTVDVEVNEAPEVEVSGVVENSCNGRLLDPWIIDTKIKNLVVTKRR